MSFTFKKCVFLAINFNIFGENCALKNFAYCVKKSTRKHIIQAMVQVKITH